MEKVPDGWGLFFSDSSVLSIADCENSTAKFMYFDMCRLGGLGLDTLWLTHLANKSQMKLLVQVGVPLGFRLR